MDRVTRDPNQRAEEHRGVSTAKKKPESMTMSFALAESTGAVWPRHQGADVKYSTTSENNKMKTCSMLGKL